MQNLVFLFYISRISFKFCARVWWKDSCCRCPICYPILCMNLTSLPFVANIALVEQFEADYCDLYHFYACYSKTCNSWKKRTSISRQYYLCSNSLNNLNTQMYAFLKNRIGTPLNKKNGALMQHRIIVYCYENLNKRDVMKTKRLAAILLSVWCFLNVFQRRAE